MAKYSVFLHGVPVGHEICGDPTDVEREYLKGFYDMKIDTPSVMRTDIVNGVSYYSYVRKNNFSNVDGRPGSYFCITVSLGRYICKDVNTLYTILEGTYQGICIGSIIKDDDTGGSFLVREMATARVKGTAITDYVQAVIEKNIDKMIDSSLMARIDGNINTHGTMRFHISEVNSPRFIDAMLKMTVLISPSFETVSKAYHTLQDKYQTLEAEYVKYTKEALRLKENLNSLEKRSADLQREMAEEKAKADKRYRNDLKAISEQLEDTKEKLSLCTKEKTDLGNKLNQLTIALEKVVEPYKLLAELMTNCSQNKSKDLLDSNPINEKRRWNLKSLTGLSWSELLLLLIVLGWLFQYCFNIFR